MWSWKRCRDQSRAGVMGLEALTGKFAPFQGSRSDRRSLAHAQHALLLGLLVMILLCEGRQLLAVLLLDGTPLLVEGLKIVKPCDTIPNLCMFISDATLPCLTRIQRTQLLTGLKPSCIVLSARQALCGHRFLL